MLRSELTKLLSAQRDTIRVLRGRVDAYEKASQLAHFILEHPDGDYDRPDIIQTEAERYGIEKLFALKQQLAASQQRVEELESTMTCMHEGHRQQMARLEEELHRASHKAEQLEAKLVGTDHIPNLRDYIEHLEREVARLEGP
jgi:chromosome segregation ATPase